MSALAPIYERVPMVWLLIGLLFDALGLYLGFDNSLSFVYLLIGWFSAAYGVALFVLRFRERPSGSNNTRLSPNFVSAGETQIIPAASEFKEKAE